MLDFDKMLGLVPAVVVDDATNEVLMLGFMNRDALIQTRQCGYVTFYSRTRRQLWMKGETSGNRLEVVSLMTDCDRDSVLARVRVGGEGLVCHLGTRSCFSEPIALTDAPVLAGSELS
jgi:phosphoribosyl-ATP pyrophosphohydrolase/phosphoribosyl-AMP cyclohydrolase